MKNKVIGLINRADFGISKLPPAISDEIHQMEITMEKVIPEELKDFYLTISNGLIFGRLKILPVLSIRNLKKTGNSIERNNSIKYSTWFDEDETSMKEFLVFCVEGGHSCFSFKKDNDFIWQWSRGGSQVVELDYKFWDWLYESLAQEKYFLFK